ncbi:MFS transporter [Kitasatospora cineracea]|uniref:MFS family arabinose efflux permease n=1 Tax=Kitasatospora cineracea TaxID=88074 RepID=A0A3N4RG13_9ACTN|nr:MFS transporter [Kitasatospora cineracea]RPE32272.1 putative MFS family arabinose efflux permease [Kitasatospora cineracea]
MFLRGFPTLWASVTISSLGDGMRFVALPLLAAELTGDARMIALVALAGQLSSLLFALPAGAWADRLDRRRMLFWADAARTLVVGVLAAAVAAHAARIGWLVLAALLLGTGGVLYSAGWSGMVPALVPPADRARANSRLQAGALVTDTLLGTPLGAVLFGLAAALPFAVDTLSFACAAGLVLLLQGDFRPGRAEPPGGAGPHAGAAGAAGAVGAPAERPALRRQVAEALRWLRGRPVLFRLCLARGLTGGVSSGLIAVLVLYASRAQHLGPTGFALLVAAFAVGGLLGSVLTPRLLQHWGVRPTLTAGALGSAACALLLALAPTPAVAALAVAAYGVAEFAWYVGGLTLRQAQVPTHLLGRVTMAHQLVFDASGAVGAALAGLLAHAWGVRAPYFVGAALLLAVPLLLPAARREAQGWALAGH